MAEALVLWLRPNEATDWMYIYNRLSFSIKLNRIVANQSLQTQNGYNLSIAVDTELKFDVVIAEGGPTERQTIITILAWAQRSSMGRGPFNIKKLADEPLPQT